MIFRRLKTPISLSVIIAVAVALLGLAAGDAVAAEHVAASAYGPAPDLKPSDYPQVAGVNSRVVIWIVAQLHLWFAAFVLSVPIFVFIIEAIGMRTRDKRYDDMAYEFIKVTITA